MRRMSIAAVAAVSTVAFAQIASAADMPTKAPIVRAPATVAANWTGFYVNGGIGYGMWAADTTTQNPLTGLCRLCANQEQGGKGWLGVIGIGYDYHFAPSWLVGVFGDYNFSSLKGSIQDQDPFWAGDIRQTSAWAVGGRLGYLVTPDFLGYVNVGYTNAHFSGANMYGTFTGAGTAFNTPSATTGGWFIGIGTESAMPSFLGLQLGPNWFWRNEYRYASYPNKTLSDTNDVISANGINFKPAVQTISTEVVYKFNSGGPKYQVAPALAPANWSGVYVNGGVGYGMWAADTTTQNPNTGVCVLCANQEQGGKGWLGMIGIGYDYQFMPKIVAGVFTDFDFSSLKGSIQDQGPYFAGEIKQTSAWAVGLRAGWLITPQILSYWNGGYTNARFSSASMVTTFAGAATTFGTSSFNDNGWFLGGGFEVAVASGWFVRTDYRYATYSRKTLSDTNGAGGVDNSITLKPAVQTVTTQAVYRFNWWR